MKKIFYIAPLIIIGLIFLLSYSKEDAPENIPVGTYELENRTDIKNDQIIVEYTDKGFVPNEISIKQGQTVEWVNKTTNPMWVASDDHPAHLIYPEFDAKKRFMENETYSFTFDKVGEWGYHNHARAIDIGKVIVTE